MLVLFDNVVVFEWDGKIVKLRVDGELGDLYISNILFLALELLG